jgi:hypothetical protein
VLGAAGAELERLGHRAVAMDLPCDDATVTFTTYADVVVEALDLARLLHEAG